MSIDIDGAMIIGELAEKITLPESIDCLGDWADDNGMRTMSPFYDSDPDFWTVGFVLKDVSVDAMDGTWLAGVRDKAKKFEALTGIKARLIGATNIF